jgi:hypothetical protein
MKKQLLALAILGAGIANAQVFTQNFSTPTPPALPAGWMQNNVDGFTVNSNLSAYQFGSNAWVTRDIGGSYGKVAVSTSWYTAANTSNDWLITPQFNVPAGSYLDWEAVAADPQYPDGYRVLLSTTGTLVTDFTTTLITVTAENPSWTEHAISLNTYSNQNVYIAFQNNSNDMYLLFVDNIKCTLPAASDGAVLSIANLTRYMAGAGTQTLSGTFKNLSASTATSAVLNYKVNNGSVVSETLTLAPSLTFAAVGNYAFATPANIPLGSNTVKVWVTHVNGTPDMVASNDTAYAKIYVGSQSVTRNALVEEFSSSTCAPCAALNTTFDPFIQTQTPNSGGRVNVIKYQVNWPSPSNDPSYNADAASRVSYYGINAAPTAMTNGTLDMVNHNQAEIDAAKAIPAFANITCSINVAGNAVTASSTITPFVGIPLGSPLKVIQVLAQESYSFANPSTSQTSFWHVMRKMFPGPKGTAFTPADGVASTFSLSHTTSTASIFPPLAAQNSNNWWNNTSTRFEYIVFVQDTVSHDVLNSGSAFFSFVTGVVEFQKESKIGVYPNPAKDNATIGVKMENSSSIDINIYDATGKLVYNNVGQQVTGGTSEIRINTSEFAAGAYNIVVKTNEGTLKDKLIIVK